MRDTLCYLIPTFLTLACTHIQGCRSGERRAEMTELATLPGISVVDIDEAVLNIKYDDGDGLKLFVANRPVKSARLRVGDRFVMSNELDYAEWYRILLLDPERVVLKRENVYDRRGSREGVRTAETVVSVAPYDLEERRLPSRHSDAP